YAYLAGLRRTASGSFSLDAATTLAQVHLATEDQRAGYLLPPGAGVAHLPTVTIDPEEETRIRRGQPLHRPTPHAGPVALISVAGGLLAIAQSGSGVLQPEKVLPAPDERA
ncbi:MAG TPA: hypothetical protein VGP33_18300, partial [Chloroflexota bacterium]|nr:hypothetical protein [Chloroflexota bacterium]